MKRFLALLLLSAISAAQAFVGVSQNAPSLTTVRPTAAAAANGGLPADCSQAIVGITEGWNSSHVSVCMVERRADGRWVRVLGPFPGRLGYNGAVWGRGLHSVPRGAVLKTESDGRSPVGIFALGGLWVTNKQPVQHDPRLPLVKVGPNDLWISDTRMPQYYNRHMRLSHPAATAWEKHEQMRQTDYPHSIKMLICHNTERPVNNGGSAVFFHIWRRNGEAATAGCTSMAEENLRALIARVNTARRPVYILLPREEYEQRRALWRLP